SCLASTSGDLSFFPFLFPTLLWGTTKSLMHAHARCMYNEALTHLVAVSLVSWCHCAVQVVCLGLPLTDLACLDTKRILDSRSGWRGGSAPLSFALVPPFSVLSQ